MSESPFDYPQGQPSSYEDMPDFMQPSYADKEPELTKWQLDPQDILEEIEHSLMGEFFNKETGKWEKNKKIEPIMNDRGIQAVMTMLRLRVNKNTFLSNFTEKQINNVCLTVHLDLQALIATEYMEYNLRKPNFDIVMGIVDIIYSALMRAQGEGERKLLRIQHKSIERVGAWGVPPQKKEKRFGLI